MHNLLKFNRKYKEFIMMTPCVMLKFKSEIVYFKIVWIRKLYSIKAQYER